MAKPSPLSDDDVRRLRMAAQRLHRPAPSAAADLVRHLGAVQAQVLPAAGVALWARSPVLTAGDVDRARLGERSIVLTWALRGTLHLVGAEDVGWLRPLVLGSRVGAAQRRLSQEGVSAGQTARAVPLIGSLLASQGPLNRRQIAAELRRRGIPTSGQAMAHLMWLAAARGLVCFGPERDGQVCFVLVQDWLGAAVPRDRDQALGELALRYLRAHGPAEPPDLAFWAGIGLRDARQAWRTIQERLLQVDTARGVRWMLSGSPAAASPGLVRLLPVFDEYLLGWRERAILADAEQWAHVNRGGGWLHAVLLSDGRALGTWATRRTSRGLRLELSPFGELAEAVVSGAREEVRGMASHLGLAIDLATA